jgi:hypothetical protein
MAIRCLCTEYRRSASNSSWVEIWPTKLLWPWHNLHLKSRSITSYSKSYWEGCIPCLSHIAPVFTKRALPTDDDDAPPVDLNSYTYAPICLCTSGWSVVWINMPVCTPQNRGAQVGICVACAPTALYKWLLWKPKYQLYLKMVHKGIWLTTDDDGWWTPQHGNSSPDPGELKRHWNIGAGRKRAVKKGLGKRHTHP